MALKNTENSYGLVSRSLHWLTALLVIAMLIGGFFMDDLDKSIKPTVYMIHKSIGLLIFSLLVIRLIWNLTTGLPNYEKTLTKTEQKISTAGHHILYVLLIVMPLTGLFMSVASKHYPSFFGLFSIESLPGIPQTKAFAKLMNESHEIIAWIFIAFVLLHIGAALKHKFILKNTVLDRMLGRS